MLVSIPSIYNESSSIFPFGTAIDDALNTILKLAKELGFRTYYGEGGYYGYAEVGTGEELIGILGHIDVVPPGNPDDWKNDPFQPVEEDGKLYGRGVQDDKGPLLASLFAVKALMDTGIHFKKRIRFIFGTDEETLWRGISKYLEREEIPSLGFSPDSEFPLIYAEKGVLQCTLRSNNKSNLHFSGGSAFNAVPDSIIYEGPQQKVLIKKLDELGFDYQVLDNGVRVMGKAAHAMVPENGINAISHLCTALHAIGLQSDVINFIAQEVKEDPFATNIFGNVNDEPSGNLKFNIGKIKLEEDETISIDIRIPVTVSKELIVKKLITTAQQYNLTYNEHDWLAPIYLSLQHPLVKTLLKVYQEVTSDYDSTPMTSGGATYARAIPNCVAYGPNFPKTPVTEHQPNENMALEELFMAMKVYAYAINELNQ